MPEVCAQPGIYGMVCFLGVESVHRTNTQFGSVWYAAKSRQAGILFLASLVRLDVTNYAQHVRSRWTVDRVLFSVCVRMGRRLVQNFLESSNFVTLSVDKNSRRMCDDCHFIGSW